MKILAFESSAKAASVAVTDDGHLTAQYFLNCGLTHSETLLAMARDMIKSAKIEAEEIDKIAVAYGPGSFTGIRIGVAAAEGFAWGLSKPVCGISTLASMAYSILTYCDVKIICPVMDARRSEVYNALFSVKNEVIERIAPDRMLKLDDLAEECRAIGDAPVLLGDGAELAKLKFSEKCVPYRMAPEVLKHQTACGVALAAAHIEPTGWITPNYLRLPGAERKRREIARGE